jgi:hypothetical protein
MIICGDLNWQTVRMGSIKTTIATFWSLARAGVLCLCSEGDVMVDELSPGNQEDCHSVVMEALVLMQVRGDGARRRKRIASDGSSRCRDTISIVWGEEPVVTVHSGPPVRMVQIVANSLH